MAATPVSEKVLAEAKEQAQEILAKADEQVQQIQDQAQRDLAELEQDIQAEVEQAGRQEEHRILAGARGAVSSEILRAKHKALEGVFAAAKEALAKMGEKEYRAMLADWLKEGAVSGQETVVPAEGEKHLDAGLLNEVNAALGEKGKLQLSKDKIPGAGGFMMQEGKVRTIATWETVLGQARRELEPEIGGRLFGSASGKA